jgi:hypothetical protein
MSSRRKVNIHFHRKASWIMFAGIASALILGFSLAQLASGFTHAGSNQKFVALNAIQQMRSMASKNPNKPPKNPHHMLVASATSQPWVSGIIDSGQAPFPADLYTINNQWQQEMDGMHLSVYAGSEAQEPAQGALIVMTISLDLQTSLGPQAYLAPSNAGALQITGSNGQSLLLTAMSGAHFTFFVTPACAMSRPKLTGKECQLVPTPSSGV